MDIEETITVSETLLVNWSVKKGLMGLKKQKLKTSTELGFEPLRFCHSKRSISLYTSFVGMLLDKVLICVALRLIPPIYLM